MDQTAVTNRLVYKQSLKENAKCYLIVQDNLLYYVIPIHSYQYDYIHYSYINLKILDYQ
jgi:hypothetical protein